MPRRSRRARKLRRQLRSLQGAQPQQPRRRRQRQRQVQDGIIVQAPREKKNYGARVGGSVGEFLGGLANNYFNTVTGMGDYTVSANSLIAGVGPPSFGQLGRGHRIRHREYIQDISGTTAFQNISFPINPGMAATFPWLSQIAANYEEYRMLGLIFEFRSTSAVALNSTNTALGVVVMGTDYNADHAPVTSKQELENFEYTSSAPPSQTFMHPIECDPRFNPLGIYYVRGNDTSAVDLRFSDLGLLQLVTSGMQAAAVIGELWVTYDVELFKPILNPTIGPSLGSAIAFHAKATTGITTGAYFGTPAAASTQVLVDDIGVFNGYASPPMPANLISVGGFSTTTIIMPQLPAGSNWLLVYDVIGASTAWVIPTFTLGSNLTQTSLNTAGTQWNVNSTGTNLLSIITFSVAAGIPSTSNTHKIQWSGGTLPTSPTSMELYIIQLPSNMA